LVDNDAFLDGWYAVRKIKDRHKPKDKTANGRVKIISFFAKHIFNIEASGFNH